MRIVIIRVQQDKYDTILFKLRSCATTQIFPGTVWVFFFFFFFFFLFGIRSLLSTVYTTRHRGAATRTLLGDTGEGE